MGEKGNGYVTWRGLVPILIALFIGLSGIAAFTLNLHSAQPHRDAATKKDTDELKANMKYMVQLKNTDNEWYRELSIDVSAMKADIANMKGDIGEIKAMMKSK